MLFLTPAVTMYAVVPEIMNTATPGQNIEVSSLDHGGNHLGFAEGKSAAFELKVPRLSSASAGCKKRRIFRRLFRGRPINLRLRTHDLSRSELRSE
jgi:hypothetical protein